MYLQVMVSGVFVLAGYSIALARAVTHVDPPSVSLQLC